METNEFCKHVSAINRAVLEGIYESIEDALEAYKCHKRDYMGAVWDMQRSGNYVMNLYTFRGCKKFSKYYQKPKDVKGKRKDQAISPTVYPGGT